VVILHGVKRKRLPTYYNMQVRPWLLGRDVADNFKEKIFTE
jgi:hypothetical protein